MWITRDKGVKVYTVWGDKPVRHSAMWTNVQGDINNSFQFDMNELEQVKELKWEDEPIEVAIVSKNINIEKRDKWIEETVKKVRKSVESRYQDYHYKENYLNEVRDALKEGYDKAVEDILGKQ